MSGHQTRRGETHCTHCRKNNPHPPKKAFLIPVALSGSQTHAGTEWLGSDPVWSSPTPAHRAAEVKDAPAQPPPVSAGRQERDYCARGGGGLGQIKGRHKQRSGVPICRAAGDPPLLELRRMRGNRCHVYEPTRTKTWASTVTHTQTGRRPDIYLTAMLDV